MHLRPVSYADLSAFASAVASAMWSDEVMAYTAPYKDIYPLSFSRYILYRISKRFYAGQFLFLVVSDPSDSSWTGSMDEVILGYSCYSTTVKDIVKPCPGGWLGNAFERWTLDLHGQYARLAKLDKSADTEAERHFRRLCETDMFGHYFESLPITHRKGKGDQHWELELLGTLPGFRRRGVGKVGLSWGFEKAKEDGVPLVLLSSIKGEKLYTSVGFRAVKKIDMVPLDGEETDATAKVAASKWVEQHADIGKGLSWNAMVWEPESMRE